MSLNIYPQNLIVMPHTHTASLKLDVAKLAKMLNLFAAVCTPLPTKAFLDSLHAGHSFPVKYSGMLDECMSFGAAERAYKANVFRTFELRLGDLLLQAKNVYASDVEQNLSLFHAMIVVLGLVIIMARHTT